MKPQMKYGIILTLKGKKYAASVVDNKLALMPFDKKDDPPAVLAFDSPKQAANWLRDLLATQTAKVRSEFMSMKPIIRSFMALPMQPAVLASSPAEARRSGEKIRLHQSQPECTKSEATPDPAD